MEWDFDIDDTIISRLHNAAVRAGNKAVGQAGKFIRANVPIDTSSLKNSTGYNYGIQESAKFKGGQTVVEVTVGGTDFRGQLMPETGKLGNLVDYAIYQEYKHLFLQGAMNDVPKDIERYLPKEL